MGYGPAIISSKVTEAELDVIFRYVTSIEDESERICELIPIFDSVLASLGILRKNARVLEEWVMPWDKSYSYYIPGGKRAVVELTRQAEPIGPTTLDPDEELDWHEIRDVPTPHKNIVYEARITWERQPSDCCPECFKTKPCSCDQS
jgi:hypothetical protein